MGSPSNLEILTLKSLVGRAQADRDLAIRELDSTRCTADDFTRLAHRALFVALEQRIRANQPLEAMSLHAATSKDVGRELLVEVLTGSEYLGLEPRARMVRDRSQRRKAIKALDVVRRMLVDEATALPSALSEAQKVLGSFAPEDSDVRNAETDVMALVDKIEAVQQGKVETMVPTGIEALDFVLGGGLPPTLTIIGSLPGVGKSSLLAAVAGQMIQAGNKVGLLSLEDDRGWVLRRLAAKASSIPLFVLGKKSLGIKQLERFSDATASVYNLAPKLVMSDASGDIGSVVARARQMVADGCRAVLVDHLGEIRLQRSERHDLDIMNALQELRAIAKTFGVPVVVASHLKRREGLDRYTAPELTDFAFSASVERMARVALGLYRIKDQPRMGVAVLKQTEGPADLELKLSLDLPYGLVAQTPVCEQLRKDYGWASE